MTSFALLFTLSAIGISETIYLVKKRLAKDTPVCPIGGGCEIVLDSKYNKLFLVPNDLLGLLAYIVMSFITAFLVLEIEPTTLWSVSLKILVFVASITSIIFTYLQWKIIRAWCFWCVMSACTIWLMGIIIYFSASI